MPKPLTNINLYPSGNITSNNCNEKWAELRDIEKLAGRISRQNIRGLSKI